MYDTMFSTHLYRHLPGCKRFCQLVALFIIAIEWFYIVYNQNGDSLFTIKMAIRKQNWMKRVAIFCAVFSTILWKNFQIIQNWNIGNNMMNRFKTFTDNDILPIIGGIIGLIPTRCFGSTQPNRSVEVHWYSSLIGQFVLTLSTICFSHISWERGEEKLCGFPPGFEQGPIASRTHTHLMTGDRVCQISLCRCPVYVKLGAEEIV